MNKKFKSFKNKMRKGADSSNVALVALAIGVIIIIGMYLFTKGIGTSTANAGAGVGDALDSVNKSDFSVNYK